SWATQCTDVRLAEWASKAVRAFIDDWCRAAGIPSRMKDWDSAGSAEPATRGFRRWLAWLRKFIAARLSSSGWRSPPHEPLPRQSARTPWMWRRAFGHHARARLRGDA